MKELIAKIMIYGTLICVLLVQVVFIILKLCKAIDWEWFLVFSPIWGSYLTFIFVGNIILFIVLHQIAGRSKKD